MHYRLGLDIGTNSIGWCLLELNDRRQPAALRDIGVRIFSDERNPKDRTSLATARRMARSMRRRRDRFVDRRDGLMRALIRHGLMPDNEVERKSLERFDPYRIRARGLYEPLAPHELGRALFHLNQRRGFKSNRNTDKSEDSDSGKIKTAVGKLRQNMGAKTLGEYLNELRLQDAHGHGPVRARLNGKGAKAEYELYPERAMLAEELDRLLLFQAAHHPDVLTNTVRHDIKRIILFQRDLKPVEPGKCTFVPTDDRARWALPLAQENRILQELNHLRLQAVGEPERALTLAERDLLAAKLMQKEKLSFDEMRKTLKRLDAKFSHESKKRAYLFGNKTAAALAKKNRFGATWHKFNQATQTVIVECLLAEEDETQLISWLCDNFGLDMERAKAVSATPLPEGYGHLGSTALSRIVPILRREVISYDKAVITAGFQHHSDFRTGEIHARLPYYGVVLERYVAFGTGKENDPLENRVGRIANPTVHVALNQLRKVVNAIIKTYGPPAQVVIETARSLPAGAQKLAEIEREQKENQDANDRRRARLGELGQADNAENRLRLRLWEELNPHDPLDRRCVYTGEQISIRRLFTDDIEIEHILPRSRTLDNGFANKTVSLRRANRLKRRSAPYEAFHATPEWSDILARAEALPANKRWRFSPDSMARFEAEEGFLARHLTDTQYISRLCREYLSAVCDAREVRVTPGRLTGLLRGKWGLNALLSDNGAKNRNDHRHHAIDAAVVAVTDRGLLQRIATAAARAEERDLDRFIDDVPWPWEGFRGALAAALEEIVVSFKPDHGTQGCLHESTAYGMVADPEAEDGFNIVSRPLKPFVDFSENELKRIRDLKLRQQILMRWETEKLRGFTLKQALAAMAKPAAEGGIEANGLRRIRLLGKEEKLIKLNGSTMSVYKALKPGENHHVDIFEPSRGIWLAETISFFDVNRKDSRPPWQTQFPSARLVMRLHKDDLLKMEHAGRERIMRVESIWQKQVVIAEHYEGGATDKRDKDASDPFKLFRPAFASLKARKARCVFVDELGRVRDPGPPA